MKNRRELSQRGRSNTIPTTAEPLSQEAKPKDSQPVQFPKNETETHDESLTQQHVSYVINESAVKILIEKLADRPKPRPIREFFAQPLVVMLIGSLVVATLTHYYTKTLKDLEYDRQISQQNIARRQSLLDGINNVRVPKLGEVWERLDADELRIDQLLDDSTSGKASNNFVLKDQNMDEIMRIIRDDRALVGKSRFWLGDSLYEKTHQYIDVTAKYALKKLGSPPETDLSDLVEKRASAKQDILKIRALFLEGESK